MRYGVWDWGDGGMTKFVLVKEAFQLAACAPIYACTDSGSC